MFACVQIEVACVRKEGFRATAKWGKVGRPSDIGRAEERQLIRRAESISGSGWYFIRKKVLQTFLVKLSNRFLFQVALSTYIRNL